MQLQMDAASVLRVLLSLVVVLLAAHFLGMLSTYYFQHDYVKGLVPMFNLDFEGNAPAWFSSGLLFMSAGFGVLADRVWDDVDLGLVAAISIIAAGVALMVALVSRLVIDRDEGAER